MNFEPGSRPEVFLTFPLADGNIVELRTTAKFTEEEYGQFLTVLRTLESGMVQQRPQFYNVILDAVGEKKIQVIKETRGATGLGLKEAKELVESAPCVVAKNLTVEDASIVADKLRQAGAATRIDKIANDKLEDLA